MHWLMERARVVAGGDLGKDRPCEQYCEAVSRSLWPWSESKLLAFVCLLALLDYVSTYAVLELSMNRYVYESGPLASWALEMGGFAGLFLVDMLSASILLLIAVSIRHLHRRVGFRNFGRTALVFFLVPYVVVTMAAVFNNIVLTFLDLSPPFG